MPTSSRDAKRKSLESRSEALAEEIAQATSQLISTSNSVERSRLERQVEELYRQLENLEKDLTSHKSGVSSGSRRDRDWQEHLPRINFNEAIEITQDLLLSSNSNSAALLLVANSHQMCGALCVSRIRDLLQESTADFKHFELECPLTSQFSQRWFIDSLARYVKLEQRPRSHKQAARKLVKKIAISMRSGNVLFFEIRGWDFDPDHSEMLTWLVEEFWIPITKALADLVGVYNRVRVVVLIMTTEPLRRPLPPELSCNRASFEVERMLELPLQNWTRDEIHQWLESYSRLSLTTQEISKLTQRIFNSSDGGVPELVRSALANQMARRDKLDAEQD